jgi:GH43 family beta-xylosidase
VFKTATILLAAVAAALGSPATFKNPLLPSGADPAVVSRDGYYYYMQTTGKNLTIWKTRDITDLADAQRKVVWTPSSSGPYSRDIWAPELHYLDGKWYIYFAADNGANPTHRIWVLQNGSQDPLEGNWIMKGKLTDPSDKWAIDATVFQDEGKLYALWSGWSDDKDGEQDIYIARLKNPWTVEGKRVRLSTPDHAWEQIGELPRQHRHVNVNEGPEILQHGGKVFLIYSASGCWTDAYSLGMLTADAKSNLLDPASWKKTDHPVFSGETAAHAFGTGHNTFFESPSGKQNWIIYHANPAPGEGCGIDRSPRAQPFTWNSDGSPNFGQPVPLGKPIEKPR